MVDSFPICLRDLGVSILCVQDTGYFSSNWLLLLYSFIPMVSPGSISVSKWGCLSQQGWPNPVWDIIWDFSPSICKFLCHVDWARPSSSPSFLAWGPILVSLASLVPSSLDNKETRDHIRRCYTYACISLNCSGKCPPGLVISGNAAFSLVLRLSSSFQLQDALLLFFKVSAPALSCQF